MTSSLRWFVDEIITFRRRVWLAGWVHDPAREITGLSVAFPDAEPVPVSRWRLRSAPGR